MRRLALLFAFLAALCVGMVPVADSVAKVEAAMAAATADHHGHSGHDSEAMNGACDAHAAKPHPGHCPACAALPAAFAPTVAAQAHGVPVVGGPERLFAAFVPVDIPPPRILPA
jgi:hypothetical protein